MRYTILMFVLLLVNCTNRTIISDDNYVNGLYSKEGKPINGIIVILNKQGNPRFTAEVDKGIPNGKWISYGYQNEIIQSGFFNPVSMEINNSKIRRIQKYEFNEGDYKETSYYVVFKSPLFESEKKSIESSIKNEAKDSLIIIKYISKEF